MTGTALILGASGRFGRHTSEAFQAAGWTVRHFRRGDDLAAAARGVDVIVNGWNPAYPDWKARLPELTAEVIGAARSAGATVLLAGNVYPYGDTAPKVLDPATPQAATNELGRLRAEMEAAYRASGVRTIVLRAGDFIDTQASGNWFDRIMAARAAKGWFTYPGDPDTPHAFAFLPDVARAAVALSDMRAELPAFADIPFAGYTLTGRELAALVASALGREQNLRPFAWWALRVLSPFWREARHLLEMRYLWNMPHRLPEYPLAALLPGFEATPMAAAFALAVRHHIHPDQAVTRGRLDHRREGVV